MIDVNETSGRVLAQFMYAELEKIARYTSVLRSGGRSLDDIVREGTMVAKSHRAQPVGGLWARQRQTNKALADAKKKALAEVDTYRATATNLINSGKPENITRGNKMLTEAARAKKQIESGVSPKDMVRPPKAPAAPTKPAAKPKSSVGQKFDRLANLTGKGVLGAGAVAGTYGAYQATQPASPYAGY